MMRIKQLLCTIILTFTTAATVYGSTYTAQTIKITSDAVPTGAIAVTDNKIITDNFSFKIPEGWNGNCVAVPDETSLSLYNKTLYETDGSGLLFTIAAYEDSSYEDLYSYSILGFGSGTTTYVLIDNYIDTFEDSESAEYQSCKSSVKSLKKSFVTFISE